MDYWVHDNISGWSGRVSAQDIAAYQSDPNVSIVAYTGQDGGASDNQLGYNPLAAQYQQKFNNQITFWNAQDARYETMSRSLYDMLSAQNQQYSNATQRAQTMAGIIENSRGPNNAFQYSNALHGADNASGSTLFNILAGQTGGAQTVSPTASQLHPLDIQKQLGSILSSGGSGGGTSNAVASLAAPQTASQTQQAAQQTASTTQGQTAASQPATQTYGSSMPAISATASAGRGSASSRHQGQSAWEQNRDALLGGQTHDAFQMAHSVTEQQLNDVAKMGNPQERAAAFAALAQRPAWTPATSYGSNWRAPSDGGQNPYRNQGVSFNYAPAGQTPNVVQGGTYNHGGQNDHNRPRAGVTVQSGSFSTPQGSSDRQYANTLPGNPLGSTDKQAQHAATGGMDVATHPETIHVGEGNHPELVSVFPLDRPGVTVPPAIAALAHAALDAHMQALANRGHGVYHDAMRGNTRGANVPSDNQDPLYGVPPAQVDGFGQNGQWTPPPDETAYGQSAPIPNYRQGTLDQYQGYPYDRQGGGPLPDISPRNRSHFDTGGVIYSDGTTPTYKNAIGAPNSAGQVKVPNAKRGAKNSKGTSTVPITQVTPTPNFTNMPPAVRSLISPSDWQLIASKYGASGGDAQDIQYLLGRGLPDQSRAPRVFGGSPF